MRRNRSNLEAFGIWRIANVLLMLARRFELVGKIRVRAHRTIEGRPRESHHFIAIGRQSLISWRWDSDKSNSAKMDGKQ